VLYLAEVQKQKGGLLGGGAKTELKLLGCQKTDQSWNPVPEEAIAAEEASKLNDGALVLVELNPNRQVKEIREAGRPLVNILQNFSRQLEKFKHKEDEIDQWKESLTFQAQELNRREMEMEARVEQLQQMEDDFQRLEAEKQEVESLRQEIETSRKEIQKLREEIERNRQELEGAWEHLRGEQRRLEENQAQLQNGKVLDEEQSRILSELLDRLSTHVAPTETVREHLNYAFEMLEQQQAVLNPHWQQLEQQTTAANEQQAEVESLSQTFFEQQNELQQNQNTFEQQSAELNVNAATLNTKQDFLRMLKEQLRQQDDLYQQIHSLAALSGDVVINQDVDVEVLENMPLEELQKMVQDLQDKLEIDSSFVHDQEQELTYKQETINELQQKINQSSELDRSQLEEELADEKDLYQMLNETLVGQRRSLLERQGIFRQHQAVLMRRQGHTTGNAQEDNKIDLKPLLLLVEAQRQQKSEELQNLEREIEELRADVELTQGMIDNQTEELEAKRQELKIMEEDLLLRRTAMAESLGRVHLYQEALQPIQDSLDGLRQKLQGIADSVAKVQETGDYQLQTITEMRQSVTSLISQPV
jgi:chromosome segregation ATPase